MNFRIVVCLVACASALVMDKEKQEKEAQADQLAAKITSESELSAEAKSMQQALLSQLAFYQTEEGKKEHDKTVKDLKAKNLKDAAEDMEWLASVAKDGLMDFGNGLKFPLIDKKSTAGLLPKGLPDFPKDAKERQQFIERLPVDAGTYSTMLNLKQDSSALVNVAQDEFKGALSSLLEESKSEVKAEVKTEKIEEAKQKTIELLKQAPKAFKKALKNWEKTVPKAATMLLQTSMAEDEQEAHEVFKQANVLAQRSQDLHKEVFESLDNIANKAQLMSVAQNRITSLLMRQSEETLKDFDSLEGCADSANDYKGAEARCLCVADNICHKAGQDKAGKTCSVVASATCMSPKDDNEAKEMATV